MRRALITVTLLLVVSSGFAGEGRIRRASRVVPGQYVVVLSDKNTLARGRADHLVARYGGRVRATYENVLKGFFAEMTEAEALALSHDPWVESVEENEIFTIAATQTVPSGPLYSSTPSTDARMAYLDRIDQPSPLIGSRVNGFYSYCSDGSGVRVYVVDTGVFPQHKEFRRPDGSYRVDPATDLTQKQNDALLGVDQQCWLVSDYSSNASHGTAVASVAAGDTFGVAKNATIVDARGVYCNGTSNLATLTFVLDWIPTDPNRYTGQPSVVNMSVGGDRRYDLGGAMASAMYNLVDTYKIIVVAAAGNDSENTYWFYPAGAPRAIAVGAYNRDSDTFWQYSNWGVNVEFYAMGQYVESASTRVTELLSIPRDEYRSELTDNAGCPKDTCSSGTSFAAPQVAGTVARYLQSNPGSTREQVVAALRVRADLFGFYITEPGSMQVPILMYVDCY